MRSWKKWQDKCCDDCKDLKSLHCGISVRFFCSEVGECPCTCEAITMPSWSCPVFRRLSSLIIYVSLKSGKHDPSPQLQKFGEGSGCPEASHPSLFAPLLLSWGSYELFLNCVLRLLLDCLKFISLLPFLKKLYWWLLPKITFHITSLKCFNGNRAYIPTLCSTVAVWFKTSHCILRC